MFDVRRRALASLVPPPRLRLSEWIEKHIVLPDGVSALPGAVRLHPPQRDIADAIGDPTIERVTIVKPVRVGFTTLLTAALGSFVSNDPAPIMSLLPTEDDCRDYVVSDIEPIFDASPILKAVMSDDADESGRNTLSSRRFPGGSLKIVAARSPRNLRRHNIRVLFCDEVDGMEPTAEGDPLMLAERRTLSFPDRKIVIGSTPHLEETSAVLKRYAASDQRTFECPCPECGEFTEIKWKHIEWESDRPETAFFRCPECGCQVEERHKPAMVESARWKVNNHDVKGHAGFRINALVSGLANASWGKLAAEFIEVKDDPLRLQTFVNTILAEGWRSEGDELDEAELSGRAEPFGLNIAVGAEAETLGIPEAVICITCGVDVQHDRLELVFLGWAHDGTIYILGADVIWGKPEDEVTWIELDVAIKTEWDHPLGGKIRVDATLIDSGDGATMAHVYAFAFPRWNRRVFAGKGASGFSRPWIEKSGKKAAGGSLWIVGVDSIKNVLVTRLSRGGSVRFSQSLPAVWFEQLASERRVVTYRRGQPTHAFKRIVGKRAEALDCTVYAMSVRPLVRFAIEDRLGELSTPTSSRLSTRPVAAPPKQGWLGNTQNFLGGR